MQKNAYNIIWVDDNIDREYEDSKRTLRKYNINVIGMPKTAIEFEYEISTKHDRVDAVITDANFCRKESDTLSDNTLSGLREIDRRITELNAKRVIPFYLYTGRYNLIENCEEDEFHYFRENNRIFHKNDGIAKLCETIISDIEHIKSNDFFIRNIYTTELKSASKIPENERTLFNALLYCFSNDYHEETISSWLNGLRKVIERIFEDCIRRQIIAPLKALNSFPNFFLNRDNDYVVKEEAEIMPLTLAHSLKYLLNITQDGSHAYETCHTNKYIRENGGLNILRSALHLTMELCTWHDKYRNEHPNPNENKDFWTIRASEGICEINKYEGNIFTPVKDKDGHWHCEMCYVRITHWDDAKMKLKDVIPNTNKQTNNKYPYYAKYDKVKE